MIFFSTINLGLIYLEYNHISLKIINLIVFFLNIIKLSFVINNLKKLLPIRTKYEY